MAINLSKPIKHTVSRTQSPSHFNLINGQVYHCSATTDLRFIGYGKSPPPRGRGRHGQQVDGSSLPLSRLFHPPHDCSLRRPHNQVPFILPHPSSLSLMQEKMIASDNRALNFRSSLSPIRDSHTKPSHVNSRALYINSSSLAIIQGNMLALNSRAFNPVFSLSPNLNPLLLYVNPRPFSVLPNLDVHGKPLQFNCRGFCRVTEGDTELDGESERDVIEGDECESGKAKADPIEVERVCKVIEELFALDRNMEAVLDECGINLTRDLVMEVLERFRHARRPAFRFFCWAGQRPGFSHDSRTYNSMMSILGKTRQFETMVTLLEEIGEKGLLTIETFQISIKAFAAAQERKKAVGIFELMKKYKFKVGIDTINHLLDSLGRAKLGKEAQALFEKLEDRFTPNLQTYSILLNSWCRVRNLLEAGKVWNEMIDKGFKPDVIAHNTMLDGLVRGHKRSDAIKLFEVMKAKGPSPNARSYAILIRYLCKQRKMKEAVECFDEMLDSGCEPDAAIYTCLITGFGNLKKMDKVYGLLKEMKEKGCPPDGRMYNALIKLMTNRQMPDDAVRIYKKMIQNGIQPTIHTYNMMMKSYFQTKSYDMGCAVWEEMKRNGCYPDDNSYIVFIGGLIKQGRSVEACKYIEEMIEKGMKAPQLDYNKFAVDFSRAGRPDILEELAQSMKFAGKFEVSNIFERWAEMMRKRVKRTDPVKRNRQFAVFRWQVNLGETSVASLFTFGWDLV